ncbi:MAG TPA: thiamine diphosphokinase [Firmicutes bacterium]|nr:thiamine diphosphokinase [Bacillota bacterium]
MIVGHGRFSGTALEVDLLRRAEMVIAADGGVRYAWVAGRRADVAVGDWDSLERESCGKEALGMNREALLAGSRVVSVPREKDETDLELALREALRSGCRELVFLGALGGRLDQTLANVQLLVEAVLHGVRASIVDGPRRVYALSGGDNDERGTACAELEVEGQPGEYLSLLAVTPVVSGVWAEGVKYPLRGEDLHFGRTRGISNEFLDERARVQVGKGVLLVVVPGERPPGRSRERGGPKP